MLDALVPVGVGEFGLAGFHPVDVAEQGVDFPVVTEQSHRLRQGPLGHRIGAESAVIQGKGADVVGVGQILVKFPQHRGAHHCLVDDRSAREGTDVKLVSPLHGGGGFEFLPDRPPGEIELAIEGISDQGFGGHHQLFDARLHFPRLRSENLRSHGNRSPT